MNTDDDTPFSTTSSYQHIPTSAQSQFRFTSGNIHSATSPGSDSPPTEISSPSPPPSSPSPPPRADSTTQYPDRTCRICLDSVPYPYTPSPSLGRLISPCTCRGTSRYVHSECLLTWRKTSSTAYYQCPTCHYRYRLRRLSFAHFLTSTGLQFALTSALLLFIIFLLGFVAEPLLSGYMPMTVELDLPESGWAAHFMRGAASLGVVGVIKVVYLIGPGGWWNVRNAIRGRDRVARLGWLLVAVGVANFFVWLWKKVGSGVRGSMARVAEEVIDVGEEGDGELGSSASASSTANGNDGDGAAVEQRWWETVWHGICTFLGIGPIQGFGER